MSKLKKSIYGQCGECKIDFGPFDWFFGNVRMDDNGYLCEKCFEEKYR